AIVSCGLAKRMSKKLTARGEGTVPGGGGKSRALPGRDGAGGRRGVCIPAAVTYRSHGTVSGLLSLSLFPGGATATVRPGSLPGNPHHASSTSPSAAAARRRGGGIRRVSAPHPDVAARPVGGRAHGRDAADPDQLGP